MCTQAPRDTAGATVDPIRGRREQLFFLGINLLGDCLCTTPTIRAFRRAHPDAFITYIVQDANHCRVLEGNPDIDRVIYSEDLSLHGEAIVTSDWLRTLPIDFRDDSVLHRFDIHALHRSHSDVFKQHICHGFARLFRMSIDSVRPIVVVTEAERVAARTLARAPYIVLGMHSTSPVVGRDGHSASKDWVFEQWLRLAKELQSWPGFDVIAVGSDTDAAVPSRYFRNLYGLPIKDVAAILEQAACVITVESGLSHLCHAVDAPMVLIYSHDVPLEWAVPREASRCRVLHDHPRSIQCSDVLAALKSVLASTKRR